jgi:hypothetical protein
LVLLSAEPECRNPMVGIDTCWARAACGQTAGVAAAPPSSVMNSRLCIGPSMTVRERGTPGLPFQSESLPQAAHCII